MTDNNCTSVLASRTEEHKADRNLVSVFLHFFRGKLKILFWHRHGNSSQTSLARKKLKTKDFRARIWAKLIHCFWWIASPKAYSF